MPQQKAKQAETDEQMATVARLIRQGRTTREIAAEIGVSQPKVVRLSQKAREFYRKSAVDDVAARRNRQLAEIEDAKREAWDGWHRSKQPATRKTTRDKETTGGSGDGDKPCNTTETILVEENQAGDPQFIRELRGLVELEAKLAGTFAPTKVANTDPSGNHEAATVHVYLPDNGRVAEGQLEEIDDDQDEGQAADLDSANS
jgi:hypothetical protein